MVCVINTASVRLDDYVVESADWKGEFKRRDTELYHHLLAEETSRLNEVLSAYSASVLIGKNESHSMGEASLEVIL